MSDLRVSPERLQQIAAKKLQQLGLTFRQTSDGRTLEGELPLKGGKVTVPGTQGPVTAARFEIYAMRTFAANAWEWLADAALEFA